MRFRKLRIAWSVAFGIAAIALCALWARSYWRHDIVVWTSNVVSFALQSDQGKLIVDFGSDRMLMPLGWSRLSFLISDDDSVPADDSASDDELRTLLGFGWDSEKGCITAAAPLPFLALTTAAIAFVPWLSFKRFSLRTLLIATTLLALLLGMIVYARSID
jgi:hypothetical protein